MLTNEIILSRIIKTKCTNIKGRMLQHKYSLLSNNILMANVLSFEEVINYFFRGIYYSEYRFNKIYTN